MTDDEISRLCGAATATRHPMARKLVGVIDQLKAEVARRIEEKNEVVRENHRLTCYKEDAR